MVEFMGLETSVPRLCQLNGYHISLVVSPSYSMCMGETVLYRIQMMRLSHEIPCVRLYEQLLTLCTTASAHFLPQYL